MSAAKTLTVDGRRAEVRPIPWRLFRRVAQARDTEEQLDIEEEVVLKCATVEGIDRDAMLDELSRPAMDALFRAAMDAGEGGDAAPFGKTP